jgi:GntR family transcriptional regulator
MSHAEGPELVLAGGAPVGRQLEEQLRRLIRAGELGPGEELPSVREVAVGLSVNPRAVEEAYASLEHEGLLTRGEGSGVLVGPPAPAAGARLAELGRLCREFLARARGGGFSAAEVLQVLHVHIDKGYAEKGCCDGEG